MTKDDFFEEYMKEELPNAGPLRRKWERFVFQFTWAVMDPSTKVFIRRIKKRK